MGAVSTLSNRPFLSILEEELGKAGRRSAAKANLGVSEADAKVLEDLMSAASIGETIKKLNEGFTRAETKAVLRATQNIIENAAKIDGKLSPKAMLNLEQAYSNALLIKFRPGEYSVKGMNDFRKAVSYIWEEARGAAKADNAKDKPLQAKIDATDAGINTIRNVEGRAKPLAKGGTGKTEPDPELKKALIAEDARHLVKDESGYSSSPNGPSSGPPGSPPPSDPFGSPGGPPGNIVNEAKVREQERLAALEAAKKQRDEFWETRKKLAGYRTDVAEALRLFEKSGDYRTKKEAFERISGYMMEVEENGVKARKPVGGVKATAFVQMRGDPQYDELHKELAKTEPKVKETVIKDGKEVVEERRFDITKGDTRPTEVIKELLQNRYMPAFEPTINIFFLPDVKMFITEPEWDKLHTELRRELLVVEQQDLVSKLGTLRESKTGLMPRGELDKIFDAFRGYENDKTYQSLKSFSKEGQKYSRYPDPENRIVGDAWAEKQRIDALGETKSGLKKIAHAENIREPKGALMGLFNPGPKARAPKEIEADLRNGFKVDLQEINKLEFFYKRYYAERAKEPEPLSGGAGIVQGIKDFFFSFGKRNESTREPSMMNRWLEWETGYRLDPLSAGIKQTLITGTFVSTTGLVVGGLGAGAALYGDPEMGLESTENLEKRIKTEPGKKPESSTWRTLGVTALTVGPGDWLKNISNNTSESPITTLYGQSIRTQFDRDPSSIVRWEKRLALDPNVSPSVAEALADYRMTKANLAEKTQEESTATREKIESNLNLTSYKAGLDVARESIASLGQEDEGLTSLKARRTARKVLDEAYVATGIPTMADIKRLTEAITEKSGEDKKLSLQEYREVQQDRAYTGLPLELRQKLDDALKPKLQ
jgi:hypothetical protein